MIAIAAMYYIKALGLSMIFVLLQGCQNSDIESSNSTANTSQVVQVNPDDIDVETLYSTTFLSPQDNKIAAKWLSIQNNKDMVLETVPLVLVDQFEQHLDYLSIHFKEDRRIIANRVVQTRDLLAKFNIQVSLLTLLEGMSSVRKSKLVGNFGDYCQFYINLRQKQLSHKQAVEKMQQISVNNESPT